MSERRYALLGRKLGHSWSVPIHGLFGNENYSLAEVEPEGLEALVRGGGYSGFNVTIPYKKSVMPLCDEISAEAREIGSVNTLVRRGDKLFGFNTDADGLRYLLAKSGISLRGKRVAVLGSGGASVTAQWLAREQGAESVSVISRGGEDNYENIETRRAKTQVVINTTPVGMFPNCGESPVDLARFPVCEGLVDVIYNPRRTMLMQQAERLGIPCAGGLAMLVAQAKRAEELFFDIEIDDAETDRVTAILQKQMANLVLVGMPGSGKSTVGALLAERTGRELVDLDGEIVRAAGKSIPEIFAQGGETAFRALEREAVAAASKRTGAIIVTGGGAVKDERNYPPLHANGVIFCVDRAIENLPRDGRPLSASADLAAMYAERRPMYERFADAFADNNGAPEKTAETILAKFDELVK